MKQLILLMISCLSLVACGNGNAKQEREKEDSGVADKEKVEDAHRYRLRAEDGFGHAHDRPALRRSSRQQSESLCQDDRGVLSKIRRPERHAVRFL